MLNPNSAPDRHPHPAFKIPWRKLLIAAAAVSAILLLLFAGTIWHLISTAPNIDEITVSPMESSTYICDSEGNYLRKLTLASSNRDIVPLNQIPDALQKAVIAIEDERFYEHGGIDVRGILRAFYSGITSGTFSEGASTITQQLIKNSVFTEWTQENSFADRFRRKVQEQYLAVQLENRISKEEILADYLNTINLGAGCYGVQAASQRYFGKDVSELAVSECAVLAAIPQNPSGYNPLLYPEANRRRQLVILNYMKAQGYLSAEEHRAAQADPVYDRILEKDTAYRSDTAYSYYEDALIDEVLEILTKEKGYSSDQAYRAVYSGGLRIFSAQDFALQQICDEEFANPANFPSGTEFGIDYALSVADAYGAVTHYGSEALRAFVRQNLDPTFDLLCLSRETAQQYADAFREYILKDAVAASGHDTDDSAPTSDNKSDKSTSASDNGSAELASDSDNNSNDSASSTRTTSELTVLAERLSLSPQPQASLVLMDQSTGLVRALVGGRGEKQASLTLNRATDTTRQPGSTFKILAAYAPALDAENQTLATLYENQPYTYKDGTPVSNWDITDYTGPTTIRDAIVRSVNVVAVRCITDISPALGFQYARRFGISTLHENYEANGSYSSDVIQPLALGGITQGVTNLELCAAYAAIANRGVYRTPKFFTKILDRHGEVVFEFAPDPPVNPALPKSDTSDAAHADFVSTDFAALSPAARDNTPILKASTAWLLTDAMRGVISNPSGTAYGSISAAGQPVAGKTGTTSSYKDIWFTGYTPYYTCSIWGGYDNNKDLPDGSIYHSYQKVLWSAVMNRIHNTLPAADFELPESVLSVPLCRVSHLPAVADGCPDTYREWFAAGTQPTGKCPLHEPLPETEPIYIYPDILDQLLSETETETESESESETQTAPPALPGESETQTTPPVLPSESEAQIAPPILPGESETQIAPPVLPGESETQNTLPILPGESETQTVPPNESEMQPASPSHSETQTASPAFSGESQNSLQDLMTRLYGASQDFTW